MASDMPGSLTLLWTESTRSMKRTNVAERAQAWVVDYSAARLQAIQRLGDLYLLARPVNARPSLILKRQTASATAEQQRASPTYLCVSSRSSQTSIE